MYKRNLEIQKWNFNMNNIFKFLMYYYYRGGQLFWLGGHFVEAEVGGGPHLLKLLHSLVNFAFQKRYKL
jgi:hypothetical protein